MNPTSRTVCRLGFRLVPVIVILLVLTLSGCVTPPVAMETPSGFAAFADQDQFRAISPEGVLIRARSVPNDPPQSLEFWAQALQRQLLESGYQLISESDFSHQAGEGVLLEWLAPVSEDDWIYLTAIAVVDATIAVVEAAGPAGQYEKYRPAIRESLESLMLQPSEQ